MVWNETIVPYDMKLSKYVIWYENDVIAYDMQCKRCMV